MALTGSTGFVGGAARRALRASGVREDGLRRLVRAGDEDVPGAVRGDLTRPASLERLCDGARTLVHAASRVAGDAARCWAVNYDGTRNLVAAAQAAGVRRIVYVSTGAVAGNTPARGTPVGDVRPAPASEASRSRLAAEQVVRDAGGVVLRPFLVHGPGDRWFVPGVRMVFARLAATLADVDPLLSTVDVGAVGAVLARLAVSHTDLLDAGSVWHLNHPRPSRVSTLVEAIFARYRLPVPQERITLAAAVQRVRDDPVATHHLALIAADRWFGSEPVWEATGVAPGPRIEDTRLPSPVTT